ncbi:MAG TPA: hypothetical protein VD837_16880 [Terriglobales bacterium]|nr:hypothetical protein [Terriglobales bacterium]
MTVFGFNTDIRSGDTVYHVQTEAHEAESSMQTAVFVRGRCIGKYVSSYVGEADADQQVHELLKQQHRFVLNSVKEGRLETLLNSTAAGRIGTPATESVDSVNANARVPERSETGFVRASTAADAGGAAVEYLGAPKPFVIEVLSSQIVCGGSGLRIVLRTVAGPKPVEGAKLTARLQLTGAPPIYSQSVSDCEGEAELCFDFRPSPQHDECAMNLLVQAAHNGHSFTRLFRLRRP